MGWKIERGTRFFAELERAASEAAAKPTWHLCLANNNVVAFDVRADDCLCRDISAEVHGIYLKYPHFRHAPAGLVESVMSIGTFGKRLQREGVTGEIVIVHSWDGIPAEKHVRTLREFAPDVVPVFQHVAERDNKAVRWVKAQVEQKGR